MKKHEISLLPNEKKKLKAIVSSGQNKAVVIRRAHILLKSDEGRNRAAMLYFSEQTVRRTRLRYVAEGLQVALEDKPHPKPGPKLNAEQEAHLVAVTCSAPPSGHARWTLELLQEPLDSGWHRVRDCS